MLKQTKKKPKSVYSLERKFSWWLYSTAENVASLLGGKRPFFLSSLMETTVLA